MPRLRLPGTGPSGQESSGRQDLGCPASPAGRTQKTLGAPCTEGGVPHLVRSEEVPGVKAGEGVSGGQRVIDAPPVPITPGGQGGVCRQLGKEDGAEVGRQRVAPGAEEACSIEGP